ncbi:MAG: lipase family protein [Pikeienuella sp.]
MPQDIGFYSSELTKQKALLMAQIAKDVYIKNADGSPDEPAILKSLKNHDAGFQAVVGTSKNSAQGALVEHEKFICLVFRGTDEWQDWLDNLSALSVELPYGDFHSGFHESCEDVWNPLFREYQRARKKEARPLYIVGHSLGGGMATVAAAKLVEMDLPFSGVYTFGQPRATKRETARMISKECSGRYFRFHNNSDLVTRMPARLMNYSHVGQCVYITEDGEFETNPGFWFRFLDFASGAVEEIKEQLLENGDLNLMEDHMMTSYISKIEAGDFSSL